MEDIFGKIHSIQTLGAVDGPGVRFVVFMQGCNLRCPYCHNPDTWDVDVGKIIGVNELFSQIIRYIPYFGKNGGVTISGGEPLLQAEFVLQLIKLCKGRNIHTAIDTSGSIYNQVVDEIITMSDLILLDIKMTSNFQYEKLIGCSLDFVMDFLRAIEKSGTEAWIRHVIVPDFNNSQDNITALYNLIAEYKCVRKIELLPFKKLCVEKYKSMNINFPFDIYPQACDEEIEILKSYICNLY